MRFLTLWKQTELRQSYSTTRTGRTETCRTVAWPALVGVPHEGTDESCGTGVETWFADGTQRSVVV